MFWIIMACVILGIIDLMCDKVGLAITMLLAVFLLLFIN